MAGSEAAAMVVVLAVTMALVQGSMAANYVVGESVGWQMTPLHKSNFYQDWEYSHAPYFTTDSLEFRWIATNSVLQVDSAAFQACTTVAPIKAWLANPGGELTSMVFPLRDYKFHMVYFISGDAGHCADGQKFFIDVFE